MIHCAVYCSFVCEISCLWLYSAILCGVLMRFLQSFEKINHGPSYARLICCSLGSSLMCKMSFRHFFFVHFCQASDNYWVKMQFQANIVQTFRSEKELHKVKSQIGLLAVHKSSQRPKTTHL